jgi:ATP-dependent Lhr-like helicase
MELAGEVKAGQFVSGLSGPQFACPEALGLMERGLPEHAVFWMNACDPASACARAPDPTGSSLPPRLPSTHLVYQGRELVLVSRRGGRDLEIRVGPEHPRIAEHLELFRSMVERHVGPRNSVVVERINGEIATHSPFASSLARFGFARDYRRLILRSAG